jgi:hypothetical protein
MRPDGYWQKLQIPNARMVRGCVLSLIRVIRPIDNTLCYESRTAVGMRQLASSICLDRIEGFAVPAECGSSITDRAKG